MQFEIVRTHSNVERERWVFYTFTHGDSILTVVQSYVRETLPSPRHRKWNEVENYYRLYYRSNSLSEPPLPDDVKEQAELEVANRTLVLRTWDR